MNKNVKMLIPILLVINLIIVYFMIVWPDIKDVTYYPHQEIIGLINKLSVIFIILGLISSIILLIVKKKEKLQYITLVLVTLPTVLIAVNYFVSSYIHSHYDPQIISEWADVSGHTRTK